MATRRSSRLSGKVVLVESVEQRDVSGQDTRILLVGGCGFVGGHLAVAFLAKGWVVCVSDVTPLPPSLEEYTIANPQWKHPLQYKRINLANEGETEAVVRDFNPTVVISIAGWGMSTFDMLSPRCWTINYEGTKTLVNVCKRLGIQRFIYTSTYNVVFHGQKIENGDETMPYAPDATHVDEYSKSKTHAERFVLESATKDFVAVAIRPGAIYGEDEMRHIPRIVHLMDLWMYSPAQIGSAVVDWVHIDNLVQAYEKLTDKLVSQDTHAMAQVNGQAYFINDNDPITNEAFLGPLCRARRRPEPLFTLPIGIMLVMSALFEWLYRQGWPTVQLFTQAEIYKAGQTHYFPPTKAAQHFGYQPTINTHEGALQLAAKYRFPVTQLRGHSRALQCVTWPWWVSIAMGMGLLACVAYEPSSLSVVDGGSSSIASSTPTEICDGTRLPSSFSSLTVYSDPVTGGIPSFAVVTQLWRVASVSASSCPSSSTSVILMHGLWALLATVLAYTKHVAYLIFRQQEVLRWVFYAACAAHLGEAVYAFCLARWCCHLSMGQCLTWTLQTACLGYPSLSRLQAFYTDDVQPLCTQSLQAYVARVWRDKRQRLFRTSN